MEQMPDDVQPVDKTTEESPVEAAGANTAEVTTEPAIEFTTETTVDIADDVTDESESTRSAADDHERIIETSQPYLGQWRGLISTTNWEKGKIITTWRAAIEASGAPVAEYSDEAWSQMAGGVTPQHVGRLRRVFQRFGESRQQYAGLYWSHFLAAIDWDDAEMWLEGAVQSKWSVSQMRRQRWETLGAIAADEPQEEQIVTSEQVEEVEEVDTTPDPVAETLTTDSVSRVQSEADEDEESRAEAEEDDDREDAGASIYADDDQEAIDFVQPFANLADLPDDVTEAFEAFKLAIVRHRLDGWAEVSCDDVLASLDALKALAKAPLPNRDASEF
ncbi:MAG: hypothetical protein KDA60_04245 [Planctomycetales bacterium]|nr:hypothetical protein [Planctomycetales bacterium]